MSQPKVTISIPTFNSALFIEKCLHAITQQTYKNIEINIVDGGSTDETLLLAKEFHVQSVLTCRDSLLASRYEGVKQSEGEYILLLDSDQILEKDTIERAVGEMKKKQVDMLVLEEKVYNPNTFIDKLFEADRRLVHEIRDYSPFTGVVLPRFYRRKILLEAMNSIPKSVIKSVGGQDHSIIYYEVWQKTQKVALINNAVFHIEPSSYWVLLKKFYRWGMTSNKAHNPRYDELLQRKERFRTGLFKKGLFKESIASIFLLFLKGVPYKFGYFRAKLSTKQHA
ncbi:MAG: glycosyltransferase family 2 protein [Candidatus Levybacteria bacterium]|nr:glycosyltransferase family 2 protein [Candidatus Levybacteria bacterium]